MAFQCLGATDQGCLLGHRQGWLRECDQHSWGALFVSTGSPVPSPGLALGQEDPHVGYA